MGCRASRERDVVLVEPEKAKPPAYDEAPADTDGLTDTLRDLSRHYLNWARTAFTHRSNSDGDELRAGMQRCVEVLTNGRTIPPNMHRAVATYVAKSNLVKDLHAFTE